MDKTIASEGGCKLSNSMVTNWTLSSEGITSISRGESEGRPEGAKRPTAGDEPREFTSRGEGGRVPNFFEKLYGFH